MKSVFSNEQLSEVVSKEIKAVFQDLIDHCLDFDDGLTNLSFPSVKNSLIKNATPKEMAQVSKLCGALSSLFVIAKKFNLNLNHKITVLEDWSKLTDIYLESKFPILYKGKKDIFNDV